MLNPIRAGWCEIARLLEIMELEKKYVDSNGDDSVYQPNVRINVAGTGEYFCKDRYFRSDTAQYRPLWRSFDSALLYWMNAI